MNGDVRTATRITGVRSNNGKQSMKALITGHRIQKLQAYDHEFIKLAIEDCLMSFQDEAGFVRGFVGMASGVDLWFCQACLNLKIPYVACVPFEGQEATMSEADAWVRQDYLNKAELIREVKNSWMVENADQAIVVWDGNKGGTHNVVQQLVENDKPFKWINPVGQKIWNCN